MHLVQATDLIHWEEASNILSDVRKRLKNMNAILWPEKQTTPDQLAKDYTLEQLHFFEHNSERIGIVVLMNHDPLFWPEIVSGTTLFFHKLAIRPEHCGKGLGRMALDTIIEYARNSGYEWVRLDCDDRPALHRLYQDYGFSLVDIIPIDPYVVGRYQLLTMRPSGRQKAASAGLNR